MPRHWISQAPVDVMGGAITEASMRSVAEPHAAVRERSRGATQAVEQKRQERQPENGQGETRELAATAETAHGQPALPDRLGRQAVGSEVLHSLNCVHAPFVPITIGRLSPSPTAR
jgi:hypothetical protein